MPRKQRGGSPASDNVNYINQSYLKALSEVPVGGQVYGLPGCQTGGSPASARVHSLLGNENCGHVDMPSSPRLAGDPANLPLYRTSGGGKRSRRGKGKRGRISKQRAGGSDWISSQYSRGPVNYPSNPELFKKFAGPYDEYVSNESLYYEGLKPGSASNYAPWPFPQKGGKCGSKKHRSKKVKKSKSYKKKSKSGKKGKGKKTMSGGNRRRNVKRSSRGKRRRSH